jgi:hypothetical protein
MLLEARREHTDGNTVVFGSSRQTYLEVSGASNRRTHNLYHSQSTWFRAIANNRQYTKRHHGTHPSPSFVISPWQESPVTMHGPCPLFKNVQIGRV